MIVNSDFESGAIAYKNYDKTNNVLYLDLIKNRKGEVNHWFYFSLDACPARFQVIIENAMQSRFSNGWAGYSPFIKINDGIWKRCDSHFNRGDKDSISIQLDYNARKIMLAWYEPYATKRLESLLNTKDYYTQIGNKKGKTILLTARQHPGETMSSFFIEGFYRKLSVLSDLTNEYNFIIIPIVNMPGVSKGFHRTDEFGVDYNFAWFDDKISCIKQVKKILKEKRLAMYFDIHGDEVSKANHLYYTGKHKTKESGKLLECLSERNGIRLISRSNIKYCIKVLLRRKRLVLGLRNTASYIESNKKVPGYVYELCAHTTSPEECYVHGENLALLLQQNLIHR